MIKARAISDLRLLLGFRPFKNNLHIKIRGTYHVRNPSRLSPPIFHTASDKNLGVGKAG